jgi:gliding motility-associated-like protein
VGPFTYTWSPTGQVSPVASGLSPGTYTITVYDAGINSTYSATTVFTSLIPLTGSVSTSPSLACNGVNNGTAAVTNLAGGSGNQTYLWSNGVSAYTTSSVNSLSSGVWSLTVTDQLSSCQISNVFLITQPPAMTLNLSAGSPSACAGGTLLLTGLNSGGTPGAGAGYGYTWTAGPATDTYVVSSPTGGNPVYTLGSTDASNCLITGTIAASFVNNPVVAVSDVSICPLAAGTLTATGATSYTWGNASTGNLFTASPSANTQYSVTGSALGCTSAATASMILKPVPVPTLTSNSPVCNGQTLQFHAIGGVGYTWNGPQAFISGVQYPVVNAASPANSGVYNLTVTAANSCTTATSISQTVNPTPTLSASGSTVCENQAMNLSAASLPGASFSWTGPNAFSAQSQNISINNPAVSLSGQYSVTATSAAGCTNTAVANVTVTAMPVASFTTNTPQCAGSNLVLNGSPTTGASNYAWYGPSGFSSASQNTLISNVPVSAAGDYTLVASRGPCAHTVIHNVVIYPLPAPTATSTAPVCEKKSFTLDVTAQGIISYSWTGPVSFTSTVQKPVIATAGFSNSGTYSVAVIDNNGCKAGTAVTVNIFANPIVVVSSPTVCIQQPATLTAEGAASYNWTGPMLVVSDQANAVVGAANSTAVTLYQVVGTSTNGCMASATASLSTRSLPVPSLSVSKARVCLNSTVSLEGYGGANNESYSWYGPGNTFYTGKTITLTLSSMYLAGTYTLAVSDLAGCRGSTATAISIDDLPSGSLLGEMQACVPFCSNYSFYSPQANEPHIAVSWQLKNKSIEGKTFNACFATAGSHTITGTFRDTVLGCTAQQFFIVTAWPQPTADFSYLPELPTEGLDELLFTSTSQGEHLANWTWYIPAQNGQPAYTRASESIAYTFKEAGVYPVAMTVKSEQGCIDTIVKAITVAPDFHVYVPNAFTPNNDNSNDVFMPVGRGVKTYHLVIFNRWGLRVFESTELEVGWNGMVNGEACENGAYSWKITASSNQGVMREMTGHVMLYR